MVHHDDIVKHAPRSEGRLLAMPTFRDKQHAPQDLVTIYQAMNHSLKETYLASTDMLIHELIEAHRRQPPQPIRHWKSDQQIEYLCRAYSIPLSESDRFIEDRIKEESAKGWKVLRRAA